MRFASQKQRIWWLLIGSFSTHPSDQLCATVPGHFEETEVTGTEVTGTYLDS